MAPSSSFAPMFSADLSWVDSQVETVGERRGRKQLKHRDTTSSVTSYGSDSSSRGSSTFWPLPTKGKTSRASSSAGATRKPSRRSLKGQKEPKMNPTWNLLGLSSALPYGPGDGPASSDDSRPPVRRSTVSGPVFTNPGFNRGQPKQRPTIEPVPEMPRTGEDVFLVAAASDSKETCVSPTDATFQEKWQISPDLNRTTSIMSASGSAKSYGSSHAASPIRHMLAKARAKSVTPTPSEPSPVMRPWRAPTDWDIMPGTPLSEPCNESNAFDDIFLCEPDPSELTDFQRFIRRMERAGPKVILDRLKEDRSVIAVDAETQEELEVEKHLWMLAALQLQNIQNSLIPNQGVGPLLGMPTLFRQPKRVLELYSNLAEVYQLSAIYPKSYISYLTTSPPLNHFPLPSNVQPLTVQETGILPLPYPSNSFNHIRAARLPAQLSASAIQPLLRDALRLLAPGGILELRLVDSTPVRATMGPRLRAWFEERVLLNLEKGFRCSRPLALLPDWTRACGFTLLDCGGGGGGRRGGRRDGVVQKLRLPAVAAVMRRERRERSERREESDRREKGERSGKKDRKGGVAGVASGAGVNVDGAEDEEAAWASAKHKRRRSWLGLKVKKSKEGGEGVEGWEVEQEEEKPVEDEAMLLGELAPLVARGLWKDVWGSFAEETGGVEGVGGGWWWDDEDIVRECWEYSTVVECGTLFAYKE